jgi:large subunit ribosomal protein L20
MRVKRGVKAKRRRNRTLKLAKGFRGRSGNTIRQATARVEKALCYAYRDRKQHKRSMRGLWIARISAALKLNGMSYSRFINGLKNSNIELDRKILADLGANSPETFVAVANVAKQNIAAN